MEQYGLVFLGGGVGASLRYWMSGVISRNLGSDFPYGILIVNLLGCFLIGLLMSLLEDRFVINPNWRIFLTIGILGGFTTFSSFSYETVAMVRDGELLLAGLYVSGSVLFAIGGTHVGSMLAKIF